eukprot:5119057-Karenia_brevis.AAC.1
MAVPLMRAQNGWPRTPDSLHSYSAYQSLPPTRFMSFLELHLRTWADRLRVSTATCMPWIIAR